MQGRARTRTRSLTWPLRRFPVSCTVMLAAAVIALAAGAASPSLASAAAAPARASVSGHQEASGSSQAAVAASTARYWTRSRMMSARNADTITLKGGVPSLRARPRPSGPAGRVPGAAPVRPLAGAPVPWQAPARSLVTPLTGPVGSPWTGNYYLPPATTTGEIFYTTSANGRTENWKCSGSAVNSSGKDVVFTAGHCVFGSMGGQVPGEGWHGHWQFVPDYDNGYEPFGVWTAWHIYTLTAYTSSQDEGDDIGAAVLNTSAAGRHIVNVVGGQGIAWNYADGQEVYDFGYPAAPPFNGETLQECDGDEFAWSPEVNSTMGLTCNFTDGSSGGPWLYSFNGEFGYVNGVNGFGYSGLPGYIFSAYFGTNAESLYNAVAGL